MLGSVLMYTGVFAIKEQYKTVIITVFSLIYWGQLTPTTKLSFAPGRSPLSERRASLSERRVLLSMKRKTNAKHGASVYICALDRKICQVEKKIGNLDTKLSERGFFLFC